MTAMHCHPNSHCYCCFFQDHLAFNTRNQAFAVNKVPVICLCLVSATENGLALLQQVQYDTFVRFLVFKMSYRTRRIIEIGTLPKHCKTTGTSRAYANGSCSILVFVYRLMNSGKYFLYGTSLGNARRCLEACID